MTSERKAGGRGFHCRWDELFFLLLLFLLFSVFLSFFLFLFSLYLLCKRGLYVFFFLFFVKVSYTFVYIFFLFFLSFPLFSSNKEVKFSSSVSFTSFALISFLIFQKNLVFLCPSPYLPSLSSPFTESFFLFSRSFIPFYSYSPSSQKTASLSANRQKKTKQKNCDIHYLFFEARLTLSLLPRFLPRRFLCSLFSSPHYPRVSLSLTSSRVGGVSSLGGRERATSRVSWGVR